VGDLVLRKRSPRNICSAFSLCVALAVITPGLNHKLWKGCYSTPRLNDYMIREACLRSGDLRDGSSDNATVILHRYRQLFHTQKAQGSLAFSLRLEPLANRGPKVRCLDFSEVSASTAASTQSMF
jgi:hypothetical protein